MEIKKIESNLKMKNFYFSKCCFERRKEISNGEYHADLKKRITKTAEHEYDVEVNLKISKNDFELLVVANAEFLYEAENYNQEEILIHKNTVAIMFPFIRSQVSLMTAQPGMMPVVLPPINTAKFNSFT